MKLATTIGWIAALSLSLSLSACKKEEKEAPTKTPPTKPDVKPDVTDKTPTTPAVTPKDPASSTPMGDHSLHVDPGAKEPAAVTHAVAIITPTKGNKASGQVMFEASDDGIKIKAELSGLPPGKHAYHVHLYGDCTGDDGKTAGTHFHFEGSSISPPADIKIITGDLGNLEAGKDGKATAEAMIKTASLQGKYSIVGRAVIVHEKANDPKSPPIGAAGGRLGCGVIGIAAAPK